MLKNYLCCSIWHTKRCLSQWCLCTVLFHPSQHVLIFFCDAFLAILINTTENRAQIVAQSANSCTVASQSTNKKISLVHRNSHPPLSWLSPSQGDCTSEMIFSPDVQLGGVGTFSLSGYSDFQFEVFGWPEKDRTMRPSVNSDIHGADGLFFVQILDHQCGIACSFNYAHWNSGKRLPKKSRTCGK